MKLNPVLCAVSILAIGCALWRLQAASAGVAIREVDIHGIPATIYRPAAGASAPVVVIAHGFAGSQQLMQSFALTFARNGYVAVTFDFAGHGRNAHPLVGSVTDENGATRTLLADLRRVAEFARPLGDGRLAVLGHSMASDIVVRFAQASPDVAATIAVSMFSPAVTADSPRNLLIIAGEWEGMLKREALRAVGLASAPAAARPGVTYGDIGRGTGRRAFFSAHVEHASVLFSRQSMGEALHWLDLSFANPRARPPALDGRGPWIMLLIGACVLFARPLSSLLPRLAVPGAGAGLAGGRFWTALLVPMLATPLLLRVLPTHFLPVLVADYLAAHFALYGLCTTAVLAALGAPWTARARISVSMPAFAAAAMGVLAYGFIAVVWPINRYVTSFIPGPQRAALIAAMLVGTLSYFLADEWLTRGPAAPRGAYAASKLAFLMSMAIAVALDFKRLFFLIIIVPVIALFFIIHGLFSGWTYRRTGHPFVAALANAVAFAWAIGVTFPLLAG